MATYATWMNVLKWLPMEDWRNLGSTCKDLRQIIHSDKSWRDQCGTLFAARCCRHGTVNHLVYLINNGFAYRDDYALCSFAAQAGNLPCLQYLLEHDFARMRICENAAAYGQYECLVFAHQFGCQWNLDDPRVTATTFAARGGHYECLVYAHKHGCPITDRAYTIAIMNEQHACAKYICNHISY
jgi:hypothetical protein